MSFYQSLTDESTATLFNAETYIALFEKTFKNLNIKDVSDFAIAQIVDSTALNPRIACLLQIHHIVCRNHCLNLGCKDMENNFPKLKELSDKTQDLHHKIRASNKLIAVLENVQQSSHALDESVSTGKLKLTAATPWNSLEMMLNSHKKAEESIWEVIETNPNRELSDESVSQNFMKELNKHLCYLTPLRLASIHMQKHCATLDNCQFQCDIIAELAKEGYGKRNHDFQYCM